MNKLLGILVSGMSLWAASAAAHDLWIQPEMFQAPPKAPVPFEIRVGHGREHQRWAVDARRVVSFRTIGPDGTVERRGALNLRDPRHDAALTFPAAGNYIVALESGPAESTLPAKRFNDYLKEEGLTLVEEFRRATDALAAPGRESFSRRAKALVRIGDGATSGLDVTRPVGLTLELVPERDPFALKRGEALPVRVFYDQKPLEGATVKLANLDLDAGPLATKVSDGEGRVAFPAPDAGAWLMTVVWSKPITGNARADFETVFSSLTFGFSRPAGR